MRLLTVALMGWLLLTTASTAKTQEPRPRVVELKAPDGTLLKATFFAAAKPGPGVLLFHQSNRTRTSWDDVAHQLAAAGINTLTVDTRGHGESGGRLEDVNKNTRTDVETAFEFLVSQPGVQREVIGLGSAGSLGVINALQAAQLHPNDIKSLVMLSGDAFRPLVEFLHQASRLPELFVVADTDEYPPTVETMLWLYARASSPSRRLIHYPAAQDAPWLWYETSDASKVPGTGSHGTDLFQEHGDLPGILVQWFVNTLIKTPGHALADPLATGAVLNQLQTPGGPAQVTQQLIETRKHDPEAQLFPEVSLDIIASGFLSDGQIKTAIEIFKLNLLAYPDSADAHFNLADAYLTDGQKDLARHLAQEALALLDAHKVPLSSWSDTDQRRAEIRQGIQEVLNKTAQ